MKSSQHTDPRWQRRRLEIMERDGFKCVACGTTSRTLNVHHIAYTGNLWDAPDADLQTLCQRCHEELGKHPKGGPFYAWEDWRDEGCVLLVGYRHCPICGCRKTECHSGCVGFQCGCVPIIHVPRWCYSGFYLQSDTMHGYPAYVCDDRVITGGVPA